MALTLKEIAAQAGVSPMTVSRTLRGSGRVDPATRTRVLAIAEQGGHTRKTGNSVLGTATAGDADTQYLRLLLVSTPGSSSSSLADIAADHGSRSPAQHSYTPQIAQALEAELTRSGGKLTHITAQRLEEIQAAITEHRAQGLVLRSLLPESWLQSLLRELPVVYAVSFDHQLGVDSVYTNEHRSAAMIYQQLTALGHTDIAWFGVTDRHVPASQKFFEAVESSSLMDRISSSIHGVRHAAWANITHCQPSERRQPLLLLERDWHHQSLEEIVEHAATELLHLRPQPTAIVVSADPVALALLAKLQTRGLHLPEDISLVSYGATYEAQQAGLASIALPMQEIAAVIPELIRRRRANPKASPLSMQFETTLLPGRTLGPRRGSAFSGAPRPRPS